MLAKSTIETLYRHPKLSEILFKPVQLQIIEKLAQGTRLSENEKRYLRGNLGKKISALESLCQVYAGESRTSYPFLDILYIYYITGHEALKHNGFGWFYDSKHIIVMNTTLKGSIHYQGKKVTFVRVRSMKGRKSYIDTTTGIYFATNEQIIKDARELKDESLIRTWKSMLKEYGTMFVESPASYPQFTEDESVEEQFEDYGV